MQLNDYQNEIIKFDIFETDKTMKESQILDMAFLDKILGLAGEAGEVSDKIKKIIRDQEGQVRPENREDLKKELGDLLWYLATSARYLDISLEDIAQANLDKLNDRLKRGAIGGNGDNR